MTKIVLNQPQVASCMGQGMTAGVSEHVWMDSLEPRTCRDDRHEIVDCLPRHRLTALGKEQPGQAVLPLGEEAPDRAQLIAGEGVIGGETALQTMDPEMAGLQIKVGAAQGNQLTDS